MAGCKVAGALAGYDAVPREERAILTYLVLSIISQGVCISGVPGK